ncbi:MAG: sigma-54 dependent transcriptional regulator [Chlamydiota bacterium]
MKRILLADDEHLTRNFLKETLTRKNFEVITAENGQEAIDLLHMHPFDFVLTDMQMPKKTGMDVLHAAKSIDPSIIVIIMTAFGSIENAVEAMHEGAFNYLIKPFPPESIETLMKKAEEHLHLIKENRYLRESIRSPIIGESAQMKKILQDIEKIAQSSVSVFISGESGTGKEVIAGAIHFLSKRADKPFIKVNCAAIPESLIESEFFGHEKGAFTGANLKKEGRFEMAHLGTLLLDEVTEIPPGLQPKLLRAIQELEFERVGGTKPVRVDVRFISTSNRMMQEAIEKNYFREDLYYRLNVMPIHIPPLRERKEDIVPIAEYFLDRFCRENHKPLKVLTEGSKKKLLDYPWPGNVRELANIMERTVVMDFERLIREEHLCIDVGKRKENICEMGLSLEEMEKLCILATLQKEHYNRKEAAKILGINVKTLQSKIQRYEKEKAIQETFSFIKNET